MGIFEKLFGKPSKEIEHAKKFIGNAIPFIQNSKNNLPNKPGIQKAINKQEFEYWSIFVALRAADAGAIIKYGIDNPLCKKLLTTMIKEFQKINPHVQQNLEYNQLFIKDLMNEGRLNKEIGSIPEANGFWILYSIKQSTIEYNDSDNKEASIIIGNWLFDKFTKYWDEIEE